jgi:4'-phosphopantetheinyl transferase
MLPYGFNGPNKTMTDTFPHIIHFFSRTPPPLVAQQVHVMAASLADLAGYSAQAVAAINEEERARAARFINPVHREQFTLVRGFLRCCLAAYLDIPAHKIEFDFNQYGKPEIQPAQNTLALRFNVSHSHRMAAFVFTLEHRVGIDIEHIKPLKNMAGLAQHVCSPREWEEFSALRVNQCEAAFFRLWTRKEAFIKGNGQGLSMGLRSIYIGLQETDVISRVQYEGRWSDNWFIKDLDCPPDYKMAVAVENPHLP